MKDLIFLYGPPVSGKTTVGEILANNLELPFIDLDKKIEELSQRKISQIFAMEGEAKFREIEQVAFQQVVEAGRAVVALGGGTLLNEDIRMQALAAGDMICLMADQATLLARLDDQQANYRPLLSEKRDLALVELLAKRAEHYLSFSQCIHVDGKAPDQVAWEVQRFLGRYYLPAIPNGYEIRVIENGLNESNNFLQNSSLNPSHIMVISDDHVAPLYAKQVIRSLSQMNCPVSQVEFSSGEAHKNLHTIEYLWDQMIQNRLDRGSLVIALGGGVVSDMAGFASATFMRGIDWAVISTSLLAMVDASFGGKTGFDLLQAKNMIGAFHTPRWVCLDPVVLTTLPQAEMINGMGEVVKHGIIGDPILYDICSHGVPKDLAKWRELISRAIAVKVEIVRQDPLEKGRRAVLNFGHTIGHGIEKLSNFTLRHGEAISIGMVIETGIAEKMGIARPGLQREISSILQNLGLPTEIPLTLQNRNNELAEIIQFDKKRSGKTIRYSLPVDISDVKTGIIVEHLQEYL